MPAADIWDDLLQEEEEVEEEEDEITASEPLNLDIVAEEEPVLSVSDEASFIATAVLTDKNPDEDEEEEEIEVPLEYSGAGGCASCGN